MPTPSLKFVIVGPPRTKKNHLRRIKRRGRTFSVQSEAYEAWEESAIIQLRAQLHKAPSDIPVVVLPYYTRDVNMKATVYRYQNSGDLLNYLAGISDVLEQAGVVSNDKLIAVVDGSRLELDRSNPRVEVELAVLR